MPKTEEEWDEVERMQEAAEANRKHYDMDELADQLGAHA